MSFFSDFLLKRSYRSVYGNKATVKIGEEDIEVLIGNKKIIHNKETAKKMLQTVYENDSVVVIKYDAEGNAELEETYVDGEKQSEKVLGNGKITNVNVNEVGLETSISKYYKNNVEYKETTYKFNNEAEKNEYTVVLLDSEVESLKNITKKQGENVVLDIQKKMLPDGRIVFYKFNDLEVELEYFDETKQIKRYSKHWEEDLFEEPSQSKNKSNNKSNKEEVKKKIGTKIRKEIIEYNKKGNIVYIETEIESVHKEFDTEGNLKKQYCIKDGKHGKEVVGKLITKNKEIRIINNSSFNDEVIKKLNEDMEVVDFRYENNVIMMYDFMFWNGELHITEEYIKVNGLFGLKKRIYDKLENGVDYRVEEEYKNDKLHAVRTINKVSKTEFYVEGSKRFIKGFDGVEKEITEDEFEVYKIADALNKA